MLTWSLMKREITERSIIREIEAEARTEVTRRNTRSIRKRRRSITGEIEAVVRIQAMKVETLLNMLLKLRRLRKER